MPDTSSRARFPTASTNPVLLHERRVRLEEAVVHRRAAVVEQHLDDAEPLVDRLEERAVPRLALAQRRLGAHALGDVAREERDAPLLGRVGVHLEMDVAVGAGKAMGEVHVRVVALNAPELHHHLGLRLRRQHVPVRLPDQLPARPAEHALGRRVHRFYRQAAAHGDVGVADALEQRRRAVGGGLGEVGVALPLPARLRLLLLEQADEGGDLLPEDVGIERLEEVVDGAGRVAGVDLPPVAVECGDEDDRREARRRQGLDVPRDLVAVHPGHLHVEDDDGEVLVQDVLERFGGVVGADEANAERLESRLEGEEVLGAVVDQEHAGGMNVLGRTAFRRGRA